MKFFFAIQPTVSPRATFCRASGALAAMILFFAGGAMAETTNALSDAEIQGRQFVQKILAALAQPPADGFTNTGVLEIRDAKGHKTQVPLVFKITVTPTNWQSVYEAASPDGVENLCIIHAPDQAGELNYHSPVPFSMFEGTPLSDHRFAGSDFFIGDLSLEFFGWTKQKVLKKEVHRSCGCTVLESTNPDPSTNGYSRVVSWIDNDSLGIVDAYAYDLNGKKLKNFYPKDLKKVDGQYQVQTLIMENLQTGSKTRLEFDLKK